MNSITENGKFTIITIGKMLSDVPEMQQIVE